MEKALFPSEEDGYFPEVSDEFSLVALVSLRTDHFEWRNEKGKTARKMALQIRLCEGFNGPAVKYTRQHIERLRRNPECVNFDS